jgi:hypothetical protein
MYTIRKSFSLLEEHALSWVNAAILDLKNRGHRLPNLPSGTVTELGRPWAMRSDETMASDRPDFVRGDAEWRRFCGERKDLWVVALYFDIPESCRFWLDDLEYTLAACRVFMRRYDHLCEVLSHAPTIATWLGLVSDASRELLYTTEGTLRIRSSSRPRGEKRKS